MDQVVIAGPSRDPVYASGFFTVALGVAPDLCAGRLGLEAAAGGARRARRHRDLAVACRAAAAAPAARDEPLAMAHCVLSAAGRG